MPSQKRLILLHRRANERFVLLLFVCKYCSMLLIDSIITIAARSTEIFALNIQFWSSAGPSILKVNTENYVRIGLDAAEYNYNCRAFYCTICFQRPMLILSKFHALFVQKEKCQHNARSLGNVRWQSKRKKKKTVYLISILFSSTSIFRSSKVCVYDKLFL